ncbi:MAG: ATP synthase F1 subunit delta [Microthrixaceae bacterium]|nr:ATP synthase F1 subunit delta [Microthrixaceae bacterium]
MPPSRSCRRASTATPTSPSSRATSTAWTPGADRGRRDHRRLRHGHVRRGQRPRATSPRWPTSCSGSPGCSRPTTSSATPSATRTCRPTAAARSSRTCCRARATDTTTALVSMVVATGRARDLGRIIESFVAMSAHAGDKEVAEVRSAIDLTEDQRARLAAALAKVTGRAVEVKVIVDPTVLGGVVAQVGDTVIDGSVRHRLQQLREVL